MQVFRLVKPGIVDKIIAFDELPKDLMANIRTRGLEGLSRDWKSLSDRHYVLEYQDVNQDKLKWQEIQSYVRRAVDRDFRLLDKLEDMALKMAPDAKSGVTLEPEDVEKNVIPIPSGVAAEEEVVATETQVVVKRRGRPRKDSVSA
jgi:hypothetical protein